jgi:hypothetical protein
MSNELDIESELVESCESPLKLAEQSFDSVLGPLLVDLPRVRGMMLVAFMGGVAYGMEVSRANYEHIGSMPREMLEECLLQTESEFRAWFIRCVNVMEGEKK